MYVCMYVRGGPRFTPPLHLNLQGLLYFVIVYRNVTLSYRCRETGLVVCWNSKDSKCTATVNHMFLVHMFLFRTHWAVNRWRLQFSGPRYHKVRWGRMMSQPTKPYRHQFVDLHTLLSLSFTVLFLVCGRECGSASWRLLYNIIQLLVKVTAGSLMALKLKSVNFYHLYIYSAVGESNSWFINGFKTENC
jgi:hypothetical protein